MSSSSARPAEACEFCSKPVGETHQHLLETAARQLQCVCDACAVLFGGQQQKYRRIPRRVRFLPEFRMSDAQWDGLMIPIGIAFLFHSSEANRVTALYPSPAGPVESQLTLDVWNEIASGNAVLKTMEPDVEGLLVYRVGPVRDHYIIPIDECFKLVAIIRLKWRGLSGGMEVWLEVQRFLQQLKERSH